MLIEINPEIILSASDRARLEQIKRWTPAEQIRLACERSVLLWRLPLWPIEETEERDFRRALMSGFFFRGCALRGANFREAILDNAVFYRCGLQRADFRWTMVTPRSFSPFCDLSGADFTGAQFMDEPPRGFRWREGTKIAESCNVPEACDDR